MRIPFEIPEVNDFNEAEGFVYLDEGFLIIKVKEKVLGMFSRDEQVIKVEPGVVQGVRLDRGTFSDRLTIHSSKVELLEAVPGKHTVGVQVKVKRKYRKEAEAFIDAVKAWKRKHRGD